MKQKNQAAGVDMPDNEFDTIVDLCKRKYKEYDLD
jgi:hypothetical protein